MRFLAPVAAVAAAALTVITATSAVADIVTNDLDSSVDSEMELVTLQYDDSGSPGIAGPSKSTMLSIVIEGKDAGDHPGCNIQGGSHYLVLEPAYDTSVVDVALSNSGRFSSCDDTVVATVTPKKVGDTDVTFTGMSRENGDPRSDFRYEPAAFKVVVERASLTDDPGAGTVCDADPAAPAWAAALLQGNNIKPRTGKNAPNYIAMVADRMGPRATFEGFEKSAHPQYENAVWAFLEGQGLTLEKGPSDVARPGWECTTSGPSV